MQNQNSKMVNFVESQSETFCTVLSLLLTPIFLGGCEKRGRRLTLLIKSWEVVFILNFLNSTF